MRLTVARFAGGCAVAGLVAVVVTGVAPAAVRHFVAADSATAPKVSVITVTAGRPSELAFKLSKTSSIPVGTVTFKVTNMGVAYHNFKICTIPVPSAVGARNSCIGKSTPTLKHGQSATLTFKFTLAGKYEFLCTVTGHAAAGMKGLLGVGVAIAAGEQTTAAHAGSGSGGTAAGGGTTTTSKTGSGSGGSGDTSGCGPGVTIKSSGASDADGDELGTEPDDNDGCI